MEQLKLMLLLLHSGLCGTDMKESLQCHNDFMLTISCSLLNLTSAHDSPQLLTFAKKYTKKTYTCQLSNSGRGRRSCSVMTNTSTSTESCDFVDFDVYGISLCESAQKCQLLESEYMPKEHIKPNAPCCLAVSHNSSQHHFTWKNTYEKCTGTTLTEHLKYQLRFYGRRDKDIEQFHETYRTNYSVDDRDFETNTEYGTEVRSKPSGTNFKGQWSDWSQEVRWRTTLNNDSTVDGFLSKHGKTVFLASGVAATLVLMLCGALLKRWRRGAFVPTPAPYFQSLYGECHGDFKSWVDAQANMIITLKPEDTLQVDSHEEETAKQDRETAYENITSDSARLQPDDGKAARGTSSVPLIQGEPPLSCNEYCTLSILQQQTTHVAGKVTSVDVEHAGRSECDYCNVSVKSE
ncbi:interleukin-21 receptor [Festucalex cinctus]